MIERREDELERFKSEIHLVAFACEEYGFTLSQNESTQVYPVIRKGDDKLVVTLGQDNHYIYFNVREQTDRGSIIDFIQHRSPYNLGQVRKYLREWQGDTPRIQSKHYPQVSKSDFSRSTVEHAFERSIVVTKSDYLARRGILETTLNDPRFANMIRQDLSGNVLFPHYDTRGITGYEIKNDAYTGFAKRGRRSLWQSQLRNTDTKLVFVESAIDALSYHQVHDFPSDTRYASLGGALGGNQQGFIRQVLESVGQRRLNVVSAFDADESGDRYHDIMVELSPVGLRITRERPFEGCNDWNGLIDKR